MQVVDRWLLGDQVDVRPSNSTRFPDPDTGGQHDVYDVEDVLFVQSVLVPAWLLPGIDVMSKFGYFVTLFGQGDAFPLAFP